MQHLLPAFYESNAPCKGCGRERGRTNNTKPRRTFDDSLQNTFLLAKAEPGRGGHTPVLHVFPSSTDGGITEASDHRVSSSTVGKQASPFPWPMIYATVQTETAFLDLETSARAPPPSRRVLTEDRQTASPLRNNTPETSILSACLPLLAACPVGPHVTGNQPLPKHQRGYPHSSLLRVPRPPFLSPTSPNISLQSPSRDRGWVDGCVCARARTQHKPSTVVVVVV